MSTMVLHHGPSCPDGFAAAWVASRVLGDRASYVSINYGDPVPNMDGVDTLYILDFSLPRATLLELSNGRSVVVLDHHKSAKEALSDLDGTFGLHVEFDMKRSGAMMAWNFFCPEKDPPQLIQYVQDRDLWTWKLPCSREVSAYLDLQPRTFEAWTAISLELENDLSNAFNVGSAILSFTDRKVRDLAKKSEPMRIRGYSFHGVNSSLFQSELGEAINQLYPDEPFSAVYFIKDGKKIFSLRSKKEGFDCSAVAKIFGGGGHPGAAGFSIGADANEVLA